MILPPVHLFFKTHFVWSDISNSIHHQDSGSHSHRKNAPDYSISLITGTQTYLSTTVSNPWTGKHHKDQTVVYLNFFFQLTISWSWIDMPNSKPSIFTNVNQLIIRLWLRTNFTCIPAVMVALWWAYRCRSVPHLLSGHTCVQYVCLVSAPTKQLKKNFSVLTKALLN